MMPGDFLRNFLPAIAHVALAASEEEFDATIALAERKAAERRR